MKVLIAIIAFHLANFGETQVTITPPIPLYCDCFNLWIENTLDFLGLPDSTKPNKLAKKILQTWGSDGCIEIGDTTTSLKYMFYVSRHGP